MTASAVADLAEVPLHLPHHPLAAMPHFPGDRVGALARPGPGPNGHGIEQLPEIREHRLLARAVAREQQPARRMLREVPLEDLPKLQPERRRTVRRGRFQSLPGVRLKGDDAAMERNVVHFEAQDFGLAAALRRNVVICS